MILTNERAELLGKHLSENKERTVALLELSPEEAAAKINAEGCDFSVEEIREFGEQLQKATAHFDELDASSLDQVAGGIATEVAGVCEACIALGVKLGLAAGSNWRW